MNEKLAIDGGPKTVIAALSSLSGHDITVVFSLGGTASESSPENGALFRKRTKIIQLCSGHLNLNFKKNLKNRQNLHLQ